MRYAANKVAGNATTTPVFVSIQTSAYSGATLLGRLLGAHPRIATVGEMNGLIAREDTQSYLCSCGCNIRKCKFWQDVGAAMNARGYAFDVGHFDTEFTLPGPSLIQRLRKGSFGNSFLDAVRDDIFRLWPGESQRLKALVARNEAFIESVLTVTGKQVFVDTSKDRLRLDALRRFSRFDIRAVHLVRDVRGVVASRIQHGSHIDARAAASQWVQLHRRLRANVAALPPNKRMCVRYEDLCQDAAGTLAQLYQFCDVDPDVRIGELQAAPLHIVGNAMRLDQLSEIKLDERWRNLLTGDQLHEIRGIAGWLCQQYGYT